MSKLTFANLKLRDMPIDVRLRPKKNLLIGTLLILAMPFVIVLGLIIILLLTAAKASCLVVLALVGTITAVIKVGRLAARHFFNPQDMILKDARDPVLYLRSFYDDYEEISDYQNKKTPEEELASVLHWVGPVIAVGKPDDSGLPFLGATRIYLKDANWQPLVENLIAISKLVVIHPEHSAGVLWELEAAKRLVKPERLLISFLHWQAFGLNSGFYERFSGRFHEIFGRALPQGTHHTTFIYFESDWTPRSIEIMPQQPLVNIFLKPWFPFLNPWFPFRDLAYSPYIPFSRIRDALVPVLRQRGMIQW